MTFDQRREKKARGERAKAFLASDFFQKDLEPFIRSQVTAAKIRAVNDVEHHGKLAFWNGFEAGLEFMRESFDTTAKDAEIDLHAPETNDESPVMAPV